MLYCGVRGKPEALLCRALCWPARNRRTEVRFDSEEQTVDSGTLLLGPRWLSRDANIIQHLNVGHGGCKQALLISKNLKWQSRWSIATPIAGRKSTELAQILGNCRYC